MPGAKELVLQVVFFLLLGGAVYGLSRLLRCNLPLAEFKNPRRSAIYSLLALSVIVTILTTLVLIIYFLRGRSPDRQIEIYKIRHLVPQVIGLAIYIIPVALVMIKNKETLATVGITRRNLWQSLLIGSALALTTFYFQPGGLISKLARLQPHHAIAFVYFFCVGFEEEFLYRGYLQTRLVAWLGKPRGWVLASVIMAYVHIINLLWIRGECISKAFLASTALIPVSLLMGFIMLRTGNLVAPGLFHTFANWVTTLR